MTRARILVRKEWYQPLASQALLESEYERLLAQASAELFPGHDWVNFKVAVDSPSGRAKPDFALVRHDYGDWWVGEAELAHHPLVGHVRPQVERLATATYDEEVAVSLLREAPRLSRTRLRRMMKGAQPRVLIVVNEPAPDWERELAPWGAGIVVAEVFRSDRGRHVLVVSGDLPAGSGEVISICRVDRYLRNMLKVDSPAALPEQETLSIRFDGRVSEWTVVEVTDTVWLKPRRTAPNFNQRREVLLTVTPSGEYEFHQRDKTIVEIA